MRYPIFMFSLVMPVYTFALAFCESVKRRASILPISSLALAFSVLAFSLVPAEEYDLFRHYERIAAYRGLALGDIIESADPGYLLFGIFSWVLNGLGLPAQVLAASYVFVSYFLIFSVFNDVKLRFLGSCSTRLVSFFLVLVCLSVGFIGLASGLRNPLANIVVFYAGYNLIIHYRLRLFFFSSCLAFLIHPFSLAPATLVLIAHSFSRFSDSGRALIFISILLIVISSQLSWILHQINSLLSNFSFYREVYLDPQALAGGKFSERLNFSGLVGEYLVYRLGLYIAIVYLLLVKPKNNDVFYLLLSVLVLYLSFFYSFHTLFARMYIFFIYLFAVYI